ncbi:ISL3 family transposase [Ktedonobacter robiniae]|uniref:ISL3 family transposase n=1 Tax=Ktedonobacter robiniae TaxID=2778365 RepID=A0ABQ3USW6_9CHLR|nr:ISL3 family transposase [Ktedonobacter robiniae]GHO55888.1 ISL3 family transposase [Ktedonobacter robiniae]
MLLDLLGLADFRTLATDEQKHHFHFQVTPIAPPLQCVHCGHHKLYRHETKLQLFLDLPIRGKRVGITVERRRYRCCACRHTFFEPLSCMDERHFMTHRMVSYIQQEALRRTFVSIADEVGVVESTIRVLFNEFATSIQPRFPDDKLLYLGIDELYLLHQYRCVITDVQNHHIIDLLRDRLKPSVLTYLCSLPDTTKERITVVCTDMWASYHDATREALPHATLVVDKFHVLKLFSGCLETVRKQTRKSLTDKQRRTLMHDRFLLLRRAHDLDEQETLIVEAWLNNFPRLQAAYHLKEAFYGIYEAPTQEIALQRYFAWLASITLDMYEAFLPLTLAIGHYGDAIFSYFTYRYTAGYTESLNGLMKLTQRMGRGYSFEAIRAKVLLTDGLRKTSRPGYREQQSHDASPETADMAVRTALAMARPNGRGTPLPTAFTAPATVNEGNSKSSGSP